MTLRRTLVLLLACIAVLTGAACSEDNSVGSGVETEGLDAGPGAGAIRDTTTTAPPTTAAPETTAAPQTTAPPPPTTAPPTTQAQPQIAITIKIQSDNAGSQFDPRVAQVRRGSVVRWVNTDSVARSVEADNGAFRSPSIPPGGSWDYKASSPGQFNYHDGTRPYAVATLQVA